MPTMAAPVTPCAVANRIALRGAPLWNWPTPNGTKFT